MMIPILVVSVCLLGAETDASAKSRITVRGRVIGVDGLPVAKAIVGTNWTPMGWYDDQGQRRSLGDANLPKDESRWTQGEMQPTSVENGVVTDEKGEFVFAARPGCSALLAFDEKREYAGLADCDFRRLTGPLEIRLARAVEVTGQMIVKSTGKPADWSNLNASLADEPADPLATRRFLMCWATDGKFKFKLPQGNYELDAHTDPTANCLRSEPIVLTLKADTPRVDLGDVLLAPKELSRTERIEIAKKEKRVVEVNELIGKPMPQWSVTDARGIDPKAGVEQFIGRWTLIYFWHMSCHPCAGTEVPRLTKFLAEQNPQPKKVAVVSFIIDAKPWNTIADADKFLEPIAKRYWSEPWTRLPQAFDKTDRTRESIAEELFGQWVLLDPRGIVAATGDDTSVGLDTLKEKSGL